MTTARVVAVHLDGRLTVEVSPHDLDAFELGQLVDLDAHTTPVQTGPPATDEGDWLTFNPPRSTP